MSELREAAKNMLNKYTELVNCGDCGNWNPEKEEEVIALRAALADKQSPVAAYMFECDLAMFEQTEANATAYSVSMGHPDKGSTVPLFRTSPPTRKEEHYGYSCMWPMSGGDSPDYTEEIIIRLDSDDGRLDYKMAKEADYPLVPLYTKLGEKA